jgi:hypothetical protein
MNRRVQNRRFEKFLPKKGKSSIGLRTFSALLRTFCRTLCKSLCKALQEGFRSPWWTGQGSLCERCPFERSLAVYTARDDPRGNGKIAC